MGSDDESTHEIDIEALRGSLAAARGTRSSDARDPSISDRETSPRARSGLGVMHTPMDPMAPLRALRSEAYEQGLEPLGTRLDAASDLDMAPMDFEQAVGEDVVELEDVEDVADVEDIEDVSMLDADGPDGSHSFELESPASIVGTVPGHDVAQALRAMMADDVSAEVGGDALPSFSLDDDPGIEPQPFDEPLLFNEPLNEPLEESQGSWPRAHAWARPATPLPAESTAVTRAAAPTLARSIGESAETTAVFRGALPAMARGETDAHSTDEVDEIATTDLVDEAAAAESRPTFDAVPNTADLTAPEHDRARSSDLDALPETELPRFTLASIPEMSEASEAPPVTTASALLGAAGNEDVTVMRASPPDAFADGDEAPSTLLASRAPPMSAATFTARVFEEEAREDDATTVGQAALTPLETRAFTDGEEVAQLTARLHRADLGLGSEPPPDLTEASPATAAEPARQRTPSDEIEEIDEEEIVELGGDELLEEDELVLDGEVVEDDRTSTSIGAPVGISMMPPAQAFEPPIPRSPRAPRDAGPPPITPDPLDAEEKALFDEGRFGPLVALYRQRVAETDGPNKKAALLLKIASVYETALHDQNEAFHALVEAFELAPDNADVVAAVDRVGKATGRIGELAEKVKRKLAPGAPDDKRVLYLGHVVYWYERVLGRGSEVSALVSEIERHDKVHPVVLRRAAQLAAMNGDAKTQREHLTRALERTIRKEEQVALYLALAGAYAGTPDAQKQYEAALEIDPECLVAVQGIKRLGKEKERHDQVQWALERQAEVAPTQAERIDALLELAELQETKFLKREAAAELLERVLAIEPSHPAALKGLERCYHALRDWPKLARILAVRSEHTFDKKAKIELLELAAEVHESKLSDPAGAVEVYRNLLLVEPKHRRALGDLGRLYEKLGDWANVATYKARLAELAPTKRASSQELVKLGDFLDNPERDPLAAKLQYERAVTVDPTNASAWEALQKLAAASGDERRVIECLEQRRKHTDVPRQRAAILVELARVHQQQRNDDAARASFEAAIQADSSNEVAAVAMLDAYAADEKWADAAPLCELLVNAAVRDRDGEALFVRLRLGTRIAAALGDAERALTSALAALDARPKDLGAQSDLVAVASQCRETAPALLAKAHAHLTRIAEEADELPADHLVRLALLQRDAGDLDSAAALFERARHLEPEDQEITRELAELYLAQGDFPRACKLKVDMARNATNADVRFELFCEAGEIWARRAEELEKAASVFEEARALRPLDPWLLQTMMWLYGELGEWGLLTGVLEDMTQAPEAQPQEKVKSLLAMAEVVRDKLEDRLRAADLYEQVLDIERHRLEVFEELVRVLTEEKNWERLERSYRKMIARVKDDDAPQLQFLLLHQLGLIYRDRLGDAARAYDALDAASRLNPDDAEVRKIVIELLVVTDNLDNAVARVRDEIDRDPHEPQLYAELYELFLRQHYFDKAWCAVNVLSRLVAEPSDEQRRFHEDYAPMPLDRVPGQIVEQAWRSHIFHADLDEGLTNIFAILTPAVARMRWNQLRPEQRVGRPFTPNHSRMHDTIRATFKDAAEILAVPTPELLLGDLGAMAPFVPALAPFGALLVCGPAVEAQSTALAYIAGKRLAEQRPELAARAFFPSVPDLTSLLNAAIRVSRNEMAKDPAGAAMDQSLAAVLTPQEAASLRSVVLQATADNTPLDVKLWSQAADLSSMRAGLLVSGDVEPARVAILAEGTSGELSARDRVGELFKFATSDLYSDLRGAIGVAVQA